MARNMWTKHYQSTWEARSGDPQLPKWLRAASLAYGMHKANGHAQFRRGQIALILGTADPRTGEILPEPNAGRAIRLAIDYGFLSPLSPLSNLRCLVVPCHAIEGPIGNPFATCPDHEGGRPNA